MRTKIIEIGMINFKGIGKRILKFDENMNFIQGDNGTGKTSVFDAFLWVLFDKNSKNASDFSIKPLDKQNNPMSGKGSEYEAFVTLDIDGFNYKFRKVLKEKWTKKKGNETEVFTGNSVEYFINDVPKSETVYKQEIQAFFSPETFRLVTDLNYFNSNAFSWQQRRTILQQISGEITEQSIIDLHPELDLIPTVFAERKTIQQKKEEIQAGKKRIKESIESTPARIDEINRSIDNEINSIEVLEAQKIELEGKIKEKNDQITDISKSFESVNENRISLIKKRGEYEAEIQRIKNAELQQVAKIKQDFTNKKLDIETSIRQLNEAKNSFKRSVESNDKRIAEIRVSNSELKAEFDKTNELKFDTNTCICPSCSQPLPQDEILQKQEQFNLSIAQKIEGLRKKSVSNNEEIKNLKSKITEYETEIGKIEGQITTKENELKLHLESEIKDFESNGTPIYVQEKAIQEINEQIEGLNTSNQDELIAQIKEEIIPLNEQLDSIKKQFNQHEMNARQIARKNELIAENENQINALALLEKFENQIDKFNKYFMEAIEKAVNSNFSENIRFKMFEQQVNGGEKPTCICLVDGVPFNDVNTGGQINAGLEVIKLLQNHFKLVAPVFVDNRESVSKIIDLDCQVINMTKVEGSEFTLNFQSVN